MTIEQVREIFERKRNNNPFVNRVRYYLSRVPGTPSYWHNVYNNFRAIIESKRMPDVFFTFSFDDLYYFIVTLNN